MTILVAIALALVQARIDAERIMAHLPINHGWMFWIKRAAVHGLPILAAAYFTGSAAVFVAAVFAWTSTHRYALNAIRGKAWDYISTSNGYDRLFLRLPGKGKAAYIAEAIVMITATHA
jgi:hypothetical protein